MPQVEQVQNSENAFLFSYPSPIYTVTAPPLTIETIEIGGAILRVYPPFRSGAANYLPMPTINPAAIPFLPGRQPRIPDDFIMPTLAAIPTLNPPRMVLNWGKEWGGDRPEPFPMDSLRIDLHHSDEAIVERFERCLISQIRALTGQWWIGHTVDRLLGRLRNTFEIDSTGAATQVPIPYASNRTVTGTEKPLDQEVWMRAIKLAAESRIPSLSVELLLDANVSVASEQYRRGMLNAAIASEIAKDAAYRRLWANRMLGSFRRGRILKKYDLPEHISRSMQKFAGRSFEREHPREFEHISDLWEARGSIAHGGPAVYGKGKAETRIEREKAREIIRAAEHLVEWLEVL